MTTTYDVSASALLPVTPEVAFDVLLDAPIEDILGDRTGLSPPVVETRGQGGAWGTPGQSRTFVLGDGGTILETLVAADRATCDYRYRLTDVTGPMKLLVTYVDGRFSFVPEGAGTRVTWSWALHPAHAVARLAMPVFAVFWRRAAAKMFDRLGSRLPA